MLDRNRIFVTLAAMVLAAGTLAFQSQAKVVVSQNAKFAESTFKKLANAYKLTKIERGFILNSCQALTEYNERAYNRCLEKVTDEFSRLGGLPNPSEYNADARSAISIACNNAKDKSIPVLYSCLKEEKSKVDELLEVELEYK